MGRLLNRQEAAEILKLVREHAAPHAHVEDVRLIGTCKRCGDDVLHCCHKGFSGGMSCQDDYLHFCASCFDQQFESIQQQEDLEAGLEAAVCPFCGYNWSESFRERSEG